MLSSSPHDSLPTGTEALPASSSNRERGPIGAWQICHDGVRGYYARRYYLGDYMVLSTDEVIEDRTLDGLRAKLPEGLTNCGAAGDNEPHIVEWWV